MKNGFKFKSKKSCYLEAELESYKNKQVYGIFCQELTQVSLRV